MASKPNYPQVQVIPATIVNPRTPRYAINQVRLNEQGFPIMPGMGSFRDEQKVRVSDGSKSYRLKGYRDDPNYQARGRGHDGVINKYFGIPYHIQRKIAREFVVVAGILRLRSFQIGPYTARSKDEETPGLKIIKRDIESEVTEKEKQEMKEMLEHVLQTGRRDFPLSVTRKDRFPQAAEKIMRDVLTFDRVAITRRFDNAGNLVDWAVIDAATIKQVDPWVGYNGDTEVIFAQEVNGRIIETFKAGEIIVDWMYQSSDIEHQYYGWSPLEEAFKEIRATIDSLKYNHGNFTQNRAPKGFFTIPEELTDDQLDELEDRWDALFNGADHAFRTPFFSGSDKIDYTSVGNTNRDMEYDKYMQLLMQLLFMAYSTDPAEVGIKFDRSPQGGGLSTGNVPKMQDASKDRGLGAVLDFEARIINRVYEGTDWGEKYEIAFSGRKIIDKDAVLERDIKKISNFSMLGEIRDKNDMKPRWEVIKQKLEGTPLDEEEKEEIVKAAVKEEFLIFNAQFMQGRAAGAEQQPEMGEMEEGMEEEEGMTEDDAASAVNESEEDNPFETGLFGDEGGEEEEEGLEKSHSDNSVYVEIENV